MVDDQIKVNRAQMLKITLKLAQIKFLVIFQSFKKGRVFIA